MRAKRSSVHALRISVSEGYKQKEATATRLRLLAGLALLEHYLHFRFAVCPDLRPER
jgi:hypothetical protein